MKIFALCLPIFLIASHFGYSEAEKSALSFKDIFKREEAALIELLEADREKGVVEVEKVANKLIKQFPDEIKAYELLYIFTEISADQESIMRAMKQLSSVQSDDPEVSMLVAQASEQYVRMVTHTFPNMEKIIKELEGLPFPAAQIELKRIKSLLNKPIEMAFTATNGDEVDLAKMKGKVVLVDFWATWCGPCIAALPDIKEVYQEYKDKGFEVIGISLDEDKDSLSRFTKWSEMPWPQYFDGLGFDGNTWTLKFGVESIPTMWLVDKQGNLVDLFARSDLKEKVEKYLAQ